MSRLRVSLVTVGCSALALLGVALEGSPARAQAGYGQLSAGAQPSFRAPGSYQRVSGRDNPALTFFGGAKALKYSPSGRTQQMPAPRPLQASAQVKPYSGIQQASSITPYLSLDQRESDTGLPNYYLFVKPQLDQQAMNQSQQLQYRRMQQQMRRASAGGAIPTGASGGMPTTGHSTQFMNNGGYYPGMQR